MSSDEETEDRTCNVQVIGTDIYYYGDVTRDTILKLITSTKKLEKELLKKAVDLDGYTPNINVHIHSDGGDLFSGMNAMDALRKTQVHVTTIAEGTCCSAATFILLGGDKRLMGKCAHVMIHQLSTGFFGKFQELRDEMDTCKKLMKTMKKVYKAETSIPKDIFKQLMKKDVYLNADECIKYQIVHGTV
jgi:ATP-dependent protease ClpP protease subunit